MPKKKGSKKLDNHDFTVNDCANAPKPVGKLKKSVAAEAPLAEQSWEQLLEDDYDIIEQINEDGTKKFVYKKKKNSNSKCEDNLDDRPGIVYPEIVWYLISRFIKPEDVGRFAGINKVTYAITKRESFWRSLYKRYCENSPKMPERLRLEYSYKAYGIRQRVIRALYHTYEVFIKRVERQEVHDTKPHHLVKWRCVNIWFCKGPLNWFIYFKFKKLHPLQRSESNKIDSFIEELEKVDANPEEDSQVLQVSCKNFYEVLPIMGMTLSSVSVTLSQGFRHHRLQMGFVTGQHVSKDVLPEYTIVLDTVIHITIFDWWHPKYPHFDNVIPVWMRDEESLPMLKQCFFANKEAADL